ncbi:MAG: hypothetical protein AB8E82_12095 [Aureispira sp.]
MSKYITLLLLIFSATILTAQNVGIGTSTPHPSAKLDVSATDRGFLLPRVTLVAVNDGTTPVNAPATGLIVYNTNAGVTGGSGEGFYYWDGTEWVPLGASATASAADNDWDINANGTGLQAIPGGSIASGDLALAAGLRSVASGRASYSHGQDNLASGMYSIATGQDNEATAIYAYAHGQNNDALDRYAYAHGEDNQSTNRYSYTYGEANISSERYAYTHGQDNQATERYAYAYGETNVASGTSAFAFGQDNVASGNASFAFGETTEAQNDFAVAFGEDNIASGTYSVVIGGFQNTSVREGAGIIGGRGNTADGNYAVVIGGRDNQIDDQYSAVIGGRDNQATNEYAVVLGGRENSADGLYSSASGRASIAASFGEMVVGLYNTTYTPISANGWRAADRIFVIGNGTGNAARSNAMTVYKDGSININDAFTLPTTDGGAGEVLTTDGSGLVSWQATSGGWGFTGNGATNPANDFIGTTNNVGLNIRTNNINRIQISNAGNIGINTGAPTALFDINGTTGFDQLRLRQSFTPTSTGDASGNVGDVSWDDDFIYIKTSTGWKRSTLATF